MGQDLFKNKRVFWITMIIILMLQVIAAFYFATLKQGFHFDEYYSYFSTNTTYGLVPTDGEWKDTNEIRSEFMVAKDARFQYGLVHIMQSYDVHPPLYYDILHTVCSLTPGVFSKWQGLSINLLFFVLSWIMLVKISALLSDHNQTVMLSSALLFGFSPAVLSGVTFIRMYMMLTFFCLLMLYIHTKAIYLDKKTLFSFYLPVFLITYLGFMTHYYFIVFLFFIGVLTFYSMIFIKKTRKVATCYVASIISGLLLAVISYTACLSHILRGYRGTEATQSFFDTSNLVMRLSFFLNLTNEYVFKNSFYVLLLVALILLLAYYYKRKREGIGKIHWTKSAKKRIWILLVGTTVGYFLVVAKTALLNAEEAVRYEMPIYGMLILIMVYMIYLLLDKLGTEKSKPYRMGFFCLLIAFVLFVQIKGLIHHDVLFVYEKADENLAWAKEHENDTVVVLYHNGNEWMIWNDSGELMQYNEIYFNSIENENIEDTKLKQTNKIYVYAARDDKTADILQDLLSQNKNLSAATKIRELRYSDLYELK